MTGHVRGPGRVKDLPAQGPGERLGEVDMVETSGTAVVNTVIPSIGVVHQLARDGQLTRAEPGRDYPYRVERVDFPAPQPRQSCTVRPVVDRVRGQVVPVPMAGLTPYARDPELSTT